MTSGDIEKVHFGHRPIVRSIISQLTVLVKKSFFAIPSLNFGASPFKFGSSESPSHTASQFKLSHFSCSFRGITVG
jgi:hypothetical protein